MKWMFCSALLLLSNWLEAQKVHSIFVTDDGSHEALAGVIVYGLESKQAVATNDEGRAQLALSTNQDSLHLVLVYIGYLRDTVCLHQPIADTLRFTLKEEEHEFGEIVVQSVRTNSRLEHTPVNVEVLGAEDMQEENSIKPGNVASILGDLSSVQIQQTSAGTANANVRIQGLNGRYTQMLRDGMPQYDGFAGGFGILQIPPLDLKQIELIKGANSTLFGGDAIAGVVNFISKTPEYQPEAIVTINRSTLAESNLNSFLAKRNSNLGFTLFVGANEQKAQDIDQDGFSDVPRFSSLTIHPTLFFYGKKKSQLTLGWNTFFEQRRGGYIWAAENPDSSQIVYTVHNRSNRNQLEAIYSRTVLHHWQLQLKNLWSAYRLQSVNPQPTTASYGITGKQYNFFSEWSVSRHWQHLDVVSGLNYKNNLFQAENIHNAIAAKQQYQTLGYFLQVTFQANASTTMQFGWRTDVRLPKKFIFLPALAARKTWNEHWYSRITAGSGYHNFSLGSFMQNQTLVVPINISNTLQPEYAWSSSVEQNLHTDFSKNGRITINESLFFTTILNPIADSTDVFNYNRGINTLGSDTYIRVDWKKMEAYVGYTYTNPKTRYTKPTATLPLTPRHRFAATFVYEINEHWRFGFESSWTGKQLLSGQSESPSYWFFAAMIEKKWKHFSFVVNGENIGDARQTRYGAIVQGSRLNPTFQPIWGPLEGRVVNASLVWRWRNNLQ